MQIAFRERTMDWRLETLAHPSRRKGSGAAAEQINRGIE